jgi:hypothetical protein
LLASWLAQLGGSAMKIAFLSVTMLALAAPAAFAQQLPQPHVAADAMNDTREVGVGNHRAWLKSMAHLTELRAKLAESWRGMGMPPQAAKMVADAYNPEKALRIRQVSLHGKSDQEIAQMMQAALKEKHYLEADQLLIDYQRQKLKRSE